MCSILYKTCFILIPIAIKLYPFLRRHLKKIYIPWYFKYNIVLFLYRTISFANLMPVYNIYIVYIYEYWKKHLMFLFNLLYPIDLCQLHQVYVVVYLSSDSKIFIRFFFWFFYFVLCLFPIFHGFFNKLIICFNNHWMWDMSTWKW